MRASHGIPTDVPFRKLSPEHRARILEGDPPAGFPGVKGFFNWLERKKYKMHIRFFLTRYRGYATCPDCGGSRLARGSPRGARARQANHRRLRPQHHTRRANFLARLP